MLLGGGVFPSFDIQLEISIREVTPRQLTGVRLGVGTLREIEREQAGNVSADDLAPDASDLALCPQRQLELGRPFLAGDGAVVNAIEAGSNDRRGGRGRAPGAGLGCHDLVEVGRRGAVPLGVKPVVSKLSALGPEPG